MKEIEQIVNTILNTTPLSEEERFRFKTAYLSHTLIDMRAFFDWSDKTSFQRQVLRALLRIPPGETRSYQQIAATIGHPRAMRAVGTTCAQNRYPLIIPCHRVVKSDGSFGNYLWGFDVKYKLINFERHKY